MPTMAKELVQFSWIMCGVLAMKRPYCSVAIILCITAATMLMLASDALVRPHLYIVFAQVSMPNKRAKINLTINN